MPEPPGCHGPRAAGRWCRSRWIRGAAALRRSAHGGGGGRSRTAEAYAVLLTHVSGLRRFRFGSVLGRVAVPVRVLLRPVVLVGRLVEGRERVRSGTPGSRVLLLGRLRIRGFRVAAVRREVRLVVRPLPWLLVRRLLVVRGLLLLEGTLAVVVPGLPVAVGGLSVVVRGLGASKSSWYLGGSMASGWPCAWASRAARRSSRISERPTGSSSRMSSGTSV